MLVVVIYPPSFIGIFLQHLYAPCSIAVTWQHLHAPLSALYWITCLVLTIFVDSAACRGLWCPVNSSTNEAWLCWSMPFTTYSMIYSAPSHLTDSGIYPGSVPNRRCSLRRIGRSAIRSTPCEYGISWKEYGDSCSQLTDGGIHPCGLLNRRCSLRRIGRSVIWHLASPASAEKTRRRLFLSSWILPEASERVWQSIRR